MPPPGPQVWVKSYDGPASDNEAFSLAVSPDGAAVFVTGKSDGSRGSRDYATVAYDSATGTRKWVRRYDGPGRLGFDAATALGVSPGRNHGVRDGDQQRNRFGGLRHGGIRRGHGDQEVAQSVQRPRETGPIRAIDLAVSPDGSTVFVGPGVSSDGQSA